ncbi:MAG TPA: TonB-dependent receptor, partial [Candidatus Acidoferrales bacterium]|nr:TonB-dependent receptor [Candidatus Acidoferrales bacterium]
EFHFDAVPLGQYSVEVSRKSFTTEVRAVTVLSGTAPVLHFQLQVAAQSESITVKAEAAPAQGESVTPTTILNREEINDTPGGARANSVAVITNYVPGAYLTHDQLHVRGGHQVSWLIDGVAIPNTNIASNLGPQIAPRDIDSIEMQRGSYQADYGDRTYGIFDVTPRTGFESNRQAELTLTAGNFYQTDDQLSFGDHTSRFAYYASVSGNRSNLGLETPTSAVIHDAANGVGGFTSMILNVDPQNQLRVVGQVRRDYYQVPFDQNDPNNSPGEFLADFNVEKDGFATVSWVHTQGPGLVFTVAPFYHFNSANYGSSPLDFPSSTTENRASNYEGGQATASWVKKQNNLRAGIYGFAQQDSDFFGLLTNDGSGVAPIAASVHPNGGLLAAYADDQLNVTSWLMLSAGFRQTHFSGGVVENATNPRVGASLRIPKLNWVFRAFYGHFYQPPPLATLSGPLLDFITNVQQLAYLPVKGERDEEHQFGVTIPFRGWVLDADTFLTRASNYFDHSNLNNSDIFFPVNVQGARINAWELTLRSPRIRGRGQLYVTYSNQLALGFGGLTGGLITPDAGSGYFLLDHDQRNTLHMGGNWSLPWNTYASTDVYYASGFTNGDAPPGPDHLEPHTTFDLTLGKNFGEKFSVSVQGVNVANRRLLLDNSFTFGGTHFLNPREIFVQVRYRFHY